MKQIIFCCLTISMLAACNSGQWSVDSEQPAVNATQTDVAMRVEFATAAAQMYWNATATHEAVERGNGYGDVVARAGTDEYAERDVHSSVIGTYAYHETFTVLACVHVVNQSGIRQIWLKTASGWVLAGDYVRGTFNAVYDLADECERVQQ